MALPLLTTAGCRHDTSPPRLAHHTPADQAADVLLNQPIVLVFNEAIDNLSALDAVEILEGETRLSYEVDTLYLRTSQVRLMLRERPERLPATLTVRVSGIRDRSGLTMEPTSFSFTTAPDWLPADLFAALSGTPASTRARPKLAELYTPKSEARLYLAWLDTSNPPQPVLASRSEGVWTLVEDLPSPDPAGAVLDLFLGILDEGLQLSWVEVRNRETFLIGWWKAEPVQGAPWVATPPLLLAQQGTEVQSIRASDANLIAWHTHDPSTGANRCHLARMTQNDDGTPSWSLVGEGAVLGLDTCTEPAPGRYRYRPALAFSDHGTLRVATWNDGAWEIVSKPLNGDAQGQAAMPHLYRAPRSGEYLAWVETAGSLHHIFVRYADWEGWKPLGDGPVHATAEPIEELAIVEPARERPLVVWSEAGQVNARSWNGASWQVVSDLPGAAANVSRSRPAFFRDGQGVYLAWIEGANPDQTRLRFARFNALGPEPAGWGRKPLPHH